MYVYLHSTYDYEEVSIDQYNVEARGWLLSLDRELGRGMDRGSLLEMLRVRFSGSLYPRWLGHLALPSCLCIYCT